MHTTPEVLSLLALGESVATPEDRAHLVQCPVCTAELEELSRVVDAARQSDPDVPLSTPHPVVWENIQREIQATTTEAGSTTPSANAPAPRRRRRAAYALVAAVALIAGLGGGFALSRSVQPAAVQAARPVHLNALPKWPGSEGQAVVKDDAQGNRVLAVQISVPEQLNGQLEVWLSDERAEHMVSMGFMDGDSGTFEIPAGMDLSTSPVVDVSVEPRNDSNPAHSTDSIVRGRLVR